MLILTKCMVNNSKVSCVSLQSISNICNIWAKNSAIRNFTYNGFLRTVLPLPYENKQTNCDKFQLHFDLMKEKQTPGHRLQNSFSSTSIEYASKKSHTKPQNQVKGKSVIDDLLEELSDEEENSDDDANSSELEKKSGNRSPAAEFIANFGKAGPKKGKPRLHRCKF